ncbi:hypothetical protein NDU88_007873 [Pleurodeles waltl]|uniref:Uncharacterized protein n=1 Tax=Pleurodeles waltl TaxID=8319 RepID=A0AAV7QR75_PLEWA|nr:hypothetical protein NDU88_007873 [Pleurodeles waltl]
MVFCWVCEQGPSESISRSFWLGGPASFVPGPPIWSPALCFPSPRGDPEARKAHHGAAGSAGSGLPRGTLSLRNVLELDPAGVRIALCPLGGFQCWGCFTLLPGASPRHHDCKALFSSAPSGAPLGPQTGALRVYLPKAPGQGARLLRSRPPICSSALRVLALRGGQRYALLTSIRRGQPGLVFLRGPSPLWALRYLDDVSGAEDWRCAGDLATRAVQAALSPHSMLAMGL